MCVSDNRMQDVVSETKLNKHKRKREIDTLPTTRLVSIDTFQDFVHHKIHPVVTSALEPIAEFRPDLIEIVMQFMIDDSDPLYLEWMVKDQRQRSTVAFQQFQARGLELDDLDQQHQIARDALQEKADEAGSIMSAAESHQRLYEMLQQLATLSAGLPQEAHVWLNQRKYRNDFLVEYDLPKDIDVTEPYDHREDARICVKLDGRDIRLSVSGPIHNPKRRFTPLNGDGRDSGSDADRPFPNPHWNSGEFATRPQFRFYNQRRWPKWFKATPLTKYQLVSSVMIECAFVEAVVDDSTWSTRSSESKYILKSTLSSDEWIDLVAAGVELDRIVACFLILSWIRLVESHPLVHGTTSSS